MRKRLGVIVFIFVFFFVSMSFASAKLSISAPEEIYNLGDKIYVTVDGIRGSDTGNLNIDLVCGNTSVNLLKISARAFSKNEEHSYSLPYKILSKADLEIDSLDGIIGECYVQVFKNEEKVSSKKFRVSDEIVVTVDLEKINYNPGEAITLNIEAIKANGDLVKGFVEGSNASDFSRTIESGKVSEVFSMPETAEAGQYLMNILVYDTLGEGMLNHGTKDIIFRINQVPAFVENSLSALEILPEEELTLGVEVYDQSGKSMTGDVDVLIVSPDKREINSVVGSGEFYSITLSSNATIGVWKIYSSFGDISSESEFKVLELQKVSFEFLDSILIVRNVGNVRYNKTINVDIGGTIQELSLDIGLGEVRKFNLRAPDGEYNVLVGDGENSIQSSMLLTGRAISVSDLKEVGIFKGYSIIWIFLILLLAGIGTVLFFRYRKTSVRVDDRTGRTSVSDRVRTVSDKVMGKIPPRYSSNVSNTLNFTNKSPDSQTLDEKYVDDGEKHGMVDLTKSRVGMAEQSLVLKGERTSSAIMAIQIRNYGSLKGNARRMLAEIVAGVKDNKGLVDWRGESVIVVFSPLMTRTYHNEILATRAGFEILGKINNYNKKFSNKIEFNIGINSGDLVASKESGKLKYTSLGNTIALAKRIADTGSGRLLVSDVVRKKLLRDLVAEKVATIGKSEVYEVSKMKDRAANQEKLKDILKRMDRP